MLTTATALTPDDLKTAILPSPPIVAPDCLVQDAIAAMARGGAPGDQGPAGPGVRADAPQPSCVLVVACGNVVGILTQQDVVRLVAHQTALDIPIRQVMEVDPVTVCVTDLDNFSGVNQLFQWGQSRRHLPVVDETGQVVGVLTHESLCHQLQFVDVIEDITQHKAAEESLKQQRDFSQLMARIVSSFVEIENEQLQTAIDQTLRQIGQVTRVDTSYLFEFSSPLAQADLTCATMTMTHEWCLQPSLSQRAKVQRVPLATFPWSMAQLQQRQVVYVPNVADLPPEAAVDKANWQRFNLASVLVVPLIQQGKVVGMMGFACFSRTFQWEENAIQLLQVMGQTIANAQERLLAKQQLQESEQRFKRAVIDAPYPIIIHAEDGEILQINQAWSDFSGYAFREIPTIADWTEKAYGNRQETVKSVIDQLYAMDDRINEGEFIIQTKNGDQRTWDFSSAPLGYLPDGRRYVLSIAVDVTDRKLAEAEQRQGQQIRTELKLLETILDVILAGYWDWHIPTQRNYLSPGLKRMFGYEDHELPLTPNIWQQLILPEDLPIALGALQSHIDGGGQEPYGVEIRYRHRDGSIVWVLCSGQVIAWDAEGKPEYVVGCHVDITQRKHSEAQLLQMAAQLKASNQELEAFAYSVSHDLRSPLRAIDGFSQALMEDYSHLVDEEGMEYFRRIRRNIVRMGNLIDDLLRLARVSRAEMRYQEVDLSVLVNEQVAELRAEDSQRRVQTTIAPEAIVVADKNLMGIVIRNLLDNAWKFTSHHAMATIEFGMVKTEAETIYFVRDDGTGFDMAYGDRLFGVFQRLHNADEFPGTGIGLATVQRVIHRHGGQVWAEAAVEQGTTVFFTLPQAPPLTQGDR